MIALKNVSYTYPFAKEPALNAVNLSVKSGECVLITGRSGSGKSTLARILSGLIPHQFKGTLDGEVRLDQQCPKSLNLAQIGQLCGLLGQDPERLFFCTDVESELAFSHELAGRPAEEINHIISQCAEKMDLHHLLDQSLFDLSEGEKQKVALASAMTRHPKWLILDEPTANLNPRMVKVFKQTLQEIRRQGVTLIIFDHRLHWCDGLADRLIVMEEGRIAKDLPWNGALPAQLQGCDGLRRFHVVAPNLPTPDQLTQNEPLLEVKNLTFGYTKNRTLFTDLNMKFPGGQCVIVSGENGAGKTTLTRLLTGLLTPKSGQLFYRGQKVSGKALLSRSALVLQNADHQLYMRSVAKEIAQAARLKKRKLPKTELISALQTVSLEALAERHPLSLSGGQKQRLSLLAALVTDAELIILDEPTSGLDAENMRLLCRLIETEKASGKLVLVVTHDEEFIEQIGDCRITLGGTNE